MKILSGWGGTQTCALESMIPQLEPQFPYQQNRNNNVFLHAAIVRLMDHVYVNCLS